MKRVIDGKEYNTNTSTWIATGQYRHEWADCNWICRTELYRTYMGAWFLAETEYPADGDIEDGCQVRQDIIPLENIDAAIDWKIALIVSSDAPSISPQQR
jgi:hypothetical protein